MLHPFVVDPAAVDNRINLIVRVNENETRAVEGMQVDCVHEVVTR